MFQAAATAVALFEIANERVVFERKREHRLEWKLERTSKILSQMIVDFVVMLVRLGLICENFSRVENIFGIERAFDFAHHLQQLIAKLVAHIFGARDADSVLGGERTFELTHQRGSFICDLPEFFQIGGAVQIEHRSHMQKSTSGKPVIAYRQTQWLHHYL